MGRAGLGLDGVMAGRKTFKHWSELGLGGGATWMKEAKSGGQRARDCCHRPFGGGSSGGANGKREMARRVGEF